MSNKKFKTYCRIIDYLDAVDAEFAELVRGTCVDMSLGSLKGKPGITLLLPKDKAYRDKIANLAYSDKTEDASKACDMLNALIIRDVLKTPADWMARKDNIPNSLYPSQKVEIDSVSGKEVVFKSGARATIDDKFKDASKKSNLAVWLLTGGEIPVTTDKPALLKSVKKGAKKGGYEVGPSVYTKLRFQIGLDVENEYLYDKLRGTIGNDIVGGNSGRPRDVYLETVLSLINYIMMVRKDSHMLQSKVLPLLSFQKVDFYNLVEPHRTHGGEEYLLPDDLIADWWNSKNQFSMKSVMESANAALNNSSAAKIFSVEGRAQVIRAIDKQRKRLNDLISSRPRAIADEIANIYNELAVSNRIGDVEGVFPSEIAGLYQREPGLKIMQDELRFITYMQFCTLEREPFDHGRFNQIVELIGEYMNAEDKERALKMLNKNSLKYLISPIERLEEIKMFINSTHFLYIPLTFDEVEHYPISHVVTKVVGDSKVFNIEKQTMFKHRRLLNAAGNVSDNGIVLDALKTLEGINPDRISPNLKDAIKQLANKM